MPHGYDDELCGVQRREAHEDVDDTQSDVVPGGGGPVALYEVGVSRGRALERTVIDALDAVMALPPQKQRQPRPAWALPRHRYSFFTRTFAKATLPVCVCRPTKPECASTLGGFPRRVSVGAR